MDGDNVHGGVMGNYWLLMDSGRGESLSLVCISAMESIRLHWTVLHLWIYTELWLNSAAHWIKQKDTYVGKGLLGRKKGVDRGRWGEERAECFHIMCFYSMCSWSFTIHKYNLFWRNCHVVIFFWWFKWWLKNILGLPFLSFMPHTHFLYLCLFIFYIATE